VVAKRISWILFCAVVFLLNVQQALAAMPCAELKAKIEDGLKAKGVQGYSLTVVPMADAAAGKLVGTCDGNTQKIVYSRSSDAQAPTAGEKNAAKPDKKPEPAK